MSHRGERPDSLNAPLPRRRSQSKEPMIPRPIKEHAVKSAIIKPNIHSLLLSTEIGNLRNCVAAFYFHHWTRDKKSVLQPALRIFGEFVGPHSQLMSRILCSRNLRPSSSSYHFYNSTLLHSSWL